MQLNKQVCAQSLVEGSDGWLGEGSDGWVKAHCAGATRWCTLLSPALHLGWAGVSLKDNVTAPKSSPSSKRQPHNPKGSSTASKYNPKTTPHPKDNPKVNTTAPKSTPQPQRQPYSPKVNSTAPQSIPLPQRQLYSPKDNPITPKTTPQLQTQPYSSKDSPTAQRQPHYLKDNPQFVSSRSLVCVQALASMGDLFLQCHHCHCFSS